MSIWEVASHVSFNWVTSRVDSLVRKSISLQQYFVNLLEIELFSSRYMVNVRKCKLSMLIMLLHSTFKA